MRFCAAFFVLLLSFTTLAYAQECPADFKRPNYSTRSAFCEIGSKVEDFYNYDKKIACEEMEVDHLIPLKFAYCSGLEGEKLREFANDPRNLRFTHWLTNRRKGAKTLLEFADTLPTEMRARVLFDGMDVLLAYNLPVDKELNAALIAIAKTQRAELAKARLPNKVWYKGELITPKRAIRKASTSVTKRTAAFATREISILPLEHIPFVGTALALGFVAWDISDSCATLNDLRDLDLALFPEEGGKIQAEEVCGLTVPTLDDLKKQLSDLDALKELYYSYKERAEVSMPDLPDLPTSFKWPSMPDIPLLDNIFGD